MTRVIITIVVIAWLLTNIIVSKKMSALQLSRVVHSGDCTVGKVFALLFYTPAWILKTIRVVVLKTIK